jgi:hypothetical protein
MKRLAALAIVGATVIALAAVGAGIAAAQTGGMTTPAPTIESAGTPTAQDSATDMPREDTSTEATPKAGSESGRKCPKEDASQDDVDSSSTPSTTTTSIALAWHSRVRVKRGLPIGSPSLVRSWARGLSGYASK